MQLTCFGACKEVTGSAHLLETNNARVLFDCGLHQGRRKEAEEKNKAWPFNPEKLTNVVLSHAHMDHSGRLPMLPARGFAGRIFCTRATRDACEYMLRDSAHIQESDAEYLNYKVARNFLHQQLHSKNKRSQLSRRELAGVSRLLKKDQWYLNKANILDVLREHHLPLVEPLYSKQEAEDVLKQFEGYPYNESFEIGPGITCTFYEAGHILGSAISIVTIRHNEHTINIAYTGDLGRFNVPILRDPTLEFAPEHRNIDLLVMESTYGDRHHGPVEDLKGSLLDVIQRTHQRGGTVVIPSFALGRTQTLLYTLHELYNEGKMPSMPVYVDSPLASRMTEVFGEHPEVYDEETHQVFLRNGQNPFQFRFLTFVGDVQESMALNRDMTPHIVISASGMCESGRILHHLRHKIHDPRSTVCFVGYQAENTLGRRILDLAAGRKNGGDPPIVRFLNKEYPINAEIVKLDGFSAHADQSELLRFVTGSNLAIRKIVLVHGEPQGQEVLKNLLHTTGIPVRIAEPGEKIVLGAKS